MTNFNEEFKKVFGNSCPPMSDWNKPRYFDANTNDCYAAEAALMSSLTSEAYNMYGFSVEYYIKDVSISRDKLNGEDPLENIVRRFKIDIYSENIPNLQKQFQIQGMVYTEVVTAQCTIEQFFEASQYAYETEQKEFEKYYPKIGDLIYMPWCDLYYEILNVKEFAEGSSFLSKPITFQFSMRVWRNSHESVDMYEANDDKMEHLRNYVELGETFNMDFRPISNVAATGDMLAVNEDLKKDKTEKARGKDNVASHVLYEKQNEGKPRIDPWDGW